MSQPVLSPTMSQPLLSPVEQPSSSNPQPAQSSRRLQAIDILRGAIMIIMSWDHSRDFLSQHKVGATGSERWSGTLSTYDNNAAVFFQRWISHFCAPGFFFTMGLGMYFMAISRRHKHNWSYTRIVQHFLLRGFILLCVGRLVDMAVLPLLIPLAAKNETLFPSQNSSGSPFHGPPWVAPFIGIWEVMTALGFTMQFVGLFVPVLLQLDAVTSSIQFPSRATQVVAVLLGSVFLALSTHYILQAQDNDPCGPICHTGINATTTANFPRFSASAVGGGQLLLRFLLYPGSFEFGTILYPLVPWCSLTFFGFAAGIMFKRDAKQGYTCVRWCGGFLLVCFVVVRYFGGAAAGNLRGWPRVGDGGSTVAWINFLTVCKYPPSVSYCVLTLSGNFVVLGGIQWWLKRHHAWQQRQQEEQEEQQRRRRQQQQQQQQQREVQKTSIVVQVLLAFGQSPLFFYTLHFWILGWLGFVVRWFAMGLPIVWVVVPWVLMLVGLFFPCRWYVGVKQSKGVDSWWKLF